MRKLKSEGYTLSKRDLELDEEPDRFGFPSELYSIMDSGCDFESIHGR